ncbi:MAG: hypothetical protein CMF62_02935, partial [Magnetococcales bacterium]|nr:hypothetical protein [Magnetococcales bacterium]
MDSKLFLLIIVILFLASLIYWELTQLKSNIYKEFGNVLNGFEKINQNLIYNIQTTVNQGVHKMRDVGTNNLLELKKINSFHHMKIKNKNHFTETDDSEMNTDVGYMSTAPKPKIFASCDNKSKSLFMSENTCDIENNNQDTNIPVYKPKNKEEDLDMSFSDESSSNQEINFEEDDNFDEFEKEVINIGKAVNNILRDDYGEDMIPKYSLSEDSLEFSSISPQVNKEKPIEVSVENNDEESVENNDEVSKENNDEVSKENNDEVSVENNDEVSKENNDEVSKENNDEVSVENNDEESV